MYEQVLAPLDLYLDELKEKHAQNVSAFFDTLVQKSGVNERENAETVAVYENHLAEIRTREDSVQSKKSKRNLAVFFIVCAFIIGLFLTVNFIRLDALCAIILLVLGGVAVFGICKVCKTINAEIGTLDTQIAELTKKANEVLRTAEMQMTPLHCLFTDYDALDLVQQTFPCVQFDRYFTGARLKDLQDFDYFPRSDLQECMVGVLSGEMYGYPFLFESYRKHTLGSCTYTGSLTIRWTTQERNSQGEMVTRSHTQTLRASIVRPKPYYNTQTCLHYGHECMPNLYFSRINKHAEDKSETQLKRTLKKGEKQLQRLTQQQLKEDKNFTEVLNTEFEVLFGATNRNDELAFRYLFTPNAQEEMLKLLLYADGYGDDFDFVKDKKRNTIYSEHTQSNGISTSTAYYYSHNFSEVKKKFYDFNNAFFKSVYFDFAPLLTISAYQDPREKTVTIQPNDLCAYNYEILADKLKEYILPREAIYECICKTSLLEKQDGKELVSITAYGYTAHERVHYESVYGDDGNWHSVPVAWTEYIPIHTNKKMLIEYAKKGETPDMNKPFVYYQGLYAYII